MQSKIILPVLLGILIVGITQFAFAEEAKVTYIGIDEEKFQQPSSKYNYQEIVFFGYVEGYSRGEQVTINIISPDNSEDEINTYASKKGEIYTLLHITNDSQIGVHQVILKYHDIEIASTSFEILE
ncbi:MAG: hypothetical protein HQ505_01955 [Nitrosopumilus sp.]|nr:hypothetical protein [Nitrosopumilus sp.]